MDFLFEDYPLSETNKLALFLLYEKFINPDSFWFSSLSPSLDFFLPLNILLPLILRIKETLPSSSSHLVHHSIVLFSARNGGVNWLSLDGVCSHKKLFSPPKV